MRHAVPVRVEIQAHGDPRQRKVRSCRVNAIAVYVGSEVLSVVLLKMWAAGKAEEVSVVGLAMVLLVLAFRGVQLGLGRAPGGRVG